MIVEHEYGGLTWYVVSVRFQTPAMAKERWEKINEHSRKKQGKFDVGLYRHGPPEDPGRELTAVTHNRTSALWINRELRGCEPNGLHEKNIEGMINRRLDFVANLRLQNARPGAYSVRRPEVGARLNPDGSMEEPVLGEG